MSPYNLALPAVAGIATMVGLALALVMTPLMYWALLGKNLYIALPILYLLAVVLTASLNHIDAWIGFHGAFVYWLSALILMKYFGPAAGD